MASKWADLPAHKWPTYRPPAQRIHTNPRPAIHGRQRQPHCRAYEEQLIDRCLPQSGGRWAYSAQPSCSVKGELST